MDSREIDRLVAEKVMGWRLKSFAGAAGGFTAWVNDDGKIVKYENDCTLHVHQYDFWRPTINIADAWQVVEKFEIVEINRIMDGYSCEITLFDPFRIRRGEAKTAPLAICLAALKAVGVDVEV